MKKSFTFPIAQATAILGALQRIAPLEDGAGRPKPIPAVFSYALVLNGMTLSGNPEIAAAEEQRQKLILQFGKKKANGDTELLPDSFQAFTKEWEPIASRPVTVELELFPAALRQHVAMLPQDMLVLMPLWEAEAAAPVEPPKRGKNRRS